jgi:hypothetical protein
MSRVVHIPYAVGQDQGGIRYGPGLLRSAVGEVGDGATPEEAITDLRGALETLIEVADLPRELSYSRIP